MAAVSPSFCTRENSRLSFSWWHFCLEVTENHQMGPGSFQPNLQQWLHEGNEILYYHPIYIHIGMELVLSCELGQGSIQGLKAPWLLQHWWWGWLTLDPTHICCSSERLGYCCVIQKRVRCKKKSQFLKGELIWYIIWPKLSDYPNGIETSWQSGTQRISSNCFQGTCQVVSQVPNICLTQLLVLMCWCVSSTENEAKPGRAWLY